MTLSLVMLFLLWRLTGDELFFLVNDTVEYWAAAHLNVIAENPYASDQLLTTQRDVGWAHVRPNVMWNPPWVLALLLPLAFISYPVAWYVWLALNFLAILFSAYWLWPFYGGYKQQSWIAWVVAFSFVPAFFALAMGQITPLVLLGLVLFLYFERRNMLWLAGACTLLIAIKPHLLYLFWLALVLWSVQFRKWALLASTGIAVVLATAMASLVNPTVVPNYVQAVTTQPPDYWTTSTFGAALRLLVGWEQFVLQFTPMFVGTVWFIYYWRRYRRQWQWADHLPLLVLVSVATSAYGWIFDLVVLLLPVLQVAVWLVYLRLDLKTGFAFTLYLVINGAALLQNLLGTDPFWHIWVAPALLLLYLFTRRHVHTLVSSPVHDSRSTQATSSGR